MSTTDKENDGIMKIFAAAKAEEDKRREEMKKAREEAGFDIFKGGRRAFTRGSLARLNELCEKAEKAAKAGK